MLGGCKHKHLFQVQYLWVTVVMVPGAGAVITGARHLAAEDRKSQEPQAAPGMLYLLYLVRPGFGCTWIRLYFRLLVHPLHSNVQRREAVGSAGGFVPRGSNPCQIFKDARTTSTLFDLLVLIQSWPTQCQPMPLSYN